MNNYTTNDSHSSPVSPAEFSPRFDAALDELDAIGAADLIMFALRNLANDAIMFAKRDGHVLLDGGLPRELELDELESLEPTSPARLSVDLFGSCDDDKYQLLIDEDADGRVNILASILAGSLVVGAVILQRQEEKTQ